ncbi:MAG: hypothetical protein R3F59_04420 [Myxococcota bacterium]
MTQPPRGNGEFAWGRFDPDEYVAHYYGDPHPDDDEAVRRTSRALAASGRTDLEVVDVGTGPNLFPLFAALPVAARLTAYEYAQSNVAWLQRAVAGPLVPPWDHFWAVARDAHGAGPADPMPALAARTEVRQGSIHDLPARAWDAATMFFCAESITERQDEFEAACRTFAGAVRPGGVLAAAFLAGSRGYRVAGEDFPAVRIGPAELEAAFADCAAGVRIEAIGAGEEIRSGYSGMLLLTARSA